MTHLLDTDVCIEVLRGAGDEARQRLRQMPQIAIASVTVAELSYGAARSSAPAANRADVERLVAATAVLELDETAAWHAGEIRAVLATAGTPVGGYELLIAAVARSRDLSLVTGNTRAFTRVPGLQIEAW